MTWFADLVEVGPTVLMVIGWAFLAIASRIAVVRLQRQQEARAREVERLAEFQRAWRAMEQGSSGYRDDAGPPKCARCDGDE